MGGWKCSYIVHNINGTCPNNEISTKKQFGTLETAPRACKHEQTKTTTTMSDTLAQSSVTCPVNCCSPGKNMKIASFWYFRYIDRKCTHVYSTYINTSLSYFALNMFITYVYVFCCFGYPLCEHVQESKLCVV